MICPKCGLELKENEKACPICEANNDIIVEAPVNDKYEEYKETEKLNEKLNEKYGFNKLLIFSILELVCCSQLFGIVAVLFLFIKLKPAIADRNFAEAEQWKRSIKIILIIGLILGMLVIALQIVLEALPMIVELAETLV